MADKLFLLIPSLQPGGMERVMTELVNYFCRQESLEVHLVLYGRTRDVFYPLSDKVTIHRPTFPFNNSKRLWHSLKTLWFVRQSVRNLKPTSILSFGELWNNFVLLACLGLPYPVYVSDRCQPDKPLSKVQTFLRKWLYPRSAGIIVQTEKAKEIYQQLFQHTPLHVIGNPIRSIQSGSDAEKENIVLSVGRLIHSKHHDELIRLFVGLNKPGWRLVIVGDDALQQKNKVRLQALIDSLDANDRVELAGQQSDVETYYRKSKIFAFTSSSEGFPNVIGEAMSAGLPVVAFDCVAGPSDMIRDGENGFLVPLFDYTAFEELLKLLVDDGYLREELGNEARKSIKKFSIEKVGFVFWSLLVNNKKSNYII